MKKNILFTIGGLVIGMLIFGIAMWNMAPSLMLIESESRYSFDEAVAVFEQNTLQKGWKIPVVHDLQETMHKFGKDVRKAVVFELCHPDYAYRILSRDDERVVAALMPCRVAIYEKSDGKVYVSRMNTALMGSMMKGIVPEVMKIASQESEDIIQSIIQ